MKKNSKIDEYYKVFSSVFGSRMDKDRFIHKHFENPIKHENPVRGYMQDNQVVGINAFMRMLVLDNGKRKKHFVSQSNDTAVLTEYRGKHIFTKIIEAEEREDRESECIIGIPNDNSYPGFIKMGWKEVAVLTHYVAVIRPMHLLLGNNVVSNVLDRVYRAVFLCNKIDVSPEYTFLKVLELDKDKWNRVNNVFSVGIERSQQYMDWKLKGNTRNPECLTIQKNGEFVGYVIWHKTQKLRGLVAQIDDFCGIEGHDIWPPVMGYFIRQVDMVDNPMVNTRSHDSDEMIGAGFFDYRKLNRRYSPQKLIVSPRCKDASYISKLQMRYLDSDIYLN